MYPPVILNIQPILHAFSMKYAVLFLFAEMLISNLKLAK